MIRASLIFIITLVIASGISTSAAPDVPKPVQVLLTTEKGAILLEVDTVNAPASAANFLNYVHKKLYDNGRFHRVLKMDNQPSKKVKIEVIQGGMGLQNAGKEGPPIKLERTNKTTLKHKNGTLSMARIGPDTATSDFFICIGDQPGLDFGGKRNLDGQGFAAFGRVIKGMEVVKAILQAPSDRQTLTPPMRIKTAREVLQP